MPRWGHLSVERAKCLVGVPRKGSYRHEIEVCGIAEGVEEGILVYSSRDLGGAQEHDQ